VSSVKLNRRLKIELLLICSFHEAMRRAKRHRLDLIQDRTRGLVILARDALTRIVATPAALPQMSTSSAASIGGEYRCHIKKKEYVCDRCSPHRERNQNRHDCVKGRKE